MEARDEVTEVVVVDDCSTDRTAEILAARRFRREATIVRHERNRGKGAAIRTGLGAARGDLLLIQDADLEYDPADYPRLLAPFAREDVTVVYGARSFGGHAAYSFWFVVGNRVVTLVTNLLFNTYIRDMETCYKVMRLSVWRALDLQADRFGIEPEITGKLLRSGHRIFEVPISYHARSRAEGKKLTWRDGVEAVLVLVRMRLRLDRRGTTPR